MASPSPSPQPTDSNSSKIQLLIKTITDFHADLSISSIQDYINSQKSGSDSSDNKGDSKKKDGRNRHQPLLGKLYRRLPSEITTGKKKGSSKEEKEEKSKSKREVNAATNSKSNNDLKQKDNLVKKYLDKIKKDSTENREKLGELIKDHIRRFEGILEKLSSGSIQSEQCLDESREEVRNFEDKVPLVNKYSSTESDGLKQSEIVELMEMFINFREKFGFDEFMEMIINFRNKFRNLKNESKFCLWCFTVFPNNAVVRKRLVENWLITEDKNRAEENREEKNKAVEDDTQEKNIDDILKELEREGFIVPVRKKRRKDVNNRFKMDPLARLAVINSRKPEDLWCKWARLEGLEKGSTQLLTVSGTACRDYEKLLALVNVSEQFPDFQSKWFSNLKKVKVLHLGRWKNSAKHFVEVQGSKFLKELKNMSALRLLSLQGVYGIREIPSSIANLSNLRVLDLRCCYYLTKLPKGLDSLKKLTYLDISECYLIEYMPKELSSLSELQVLKGFLVTDAKPNDKICTLEDLGNSLKELRKLSIYVNNNAIPIEKLSESLEKFKNLLKLKIAWGAGYSKCRNQEGNNEHNKKQEDEAETQGKGGLDGTFGQKDRLLEKLDLHCFPLESLPNWLSGLNLRKLYIRGGQLRSLQGDTHKKYSTVKVLRLRYLNELNVNWRELQALFPDLEYLEKFNCPMISFFPCDANGVWIKESSPEGSKNSSII
ncbi:hypothetical protein WN943_023672 [Citrus x changshan-huyou]